MSEGYWEYIVSREIPELLEGGSEEREKYKSDRGFEEAEDERDC